VKTDEAYRKILVSLKKRMKGATIADVCADTALPLSEVSDLLPKAADEYSGHLKVTSSGEILYHFPGGFINRYRGFAAVFKRFFDKITNVVKKGLALLFKVWIMVMLIGYFVLFLAIALASVFIQIAAKANDKGGSGGSLQFGLFNILFRIWFFSEITRPNDRYRNNTVKPKKEKRPMHKAIFSFVFGDDDPDKNWEEIQNSAIINYIQANSGVISLVEYMAFTGGDSIEAEKNILAFCSKFEGSPEITEEGTIVYRFEKLLLRLSPEKNDNLIPPLKKQKIFSKNKKGQNIWFIAINAFNLLFGSYFLYQSAAAGPLIDLIQYQAAPAIYSYTHYFLQFIMEEPHNFIRIVLGIVPLVFSLFFWLIPAVRYLFMKKDNSAIKLLNFKKSGFRRIWSSPCNIEKESFKIQPDDFNINDQNRAFDRVIKDIGAVSVPDIEVADNGNAFYSFKELEKEKKAIEKYRKNIDAQKFQLGVIEFDSAK